MTSILDDPEARRRVRLCAAAEVPEATVKAVRPAGLEPIAVYRIAGQFYATQDTCTHGRASLAEGWLDGDVIGCPVHSGEFEVRTGRPMCFPASKPLKTFPVWLEGEDLLADLSCADLLDPPGAPT